MSDGAERAKLKAYLTGVNHAATDAASDNWRASGLLLRQTAAAIRSGAVKVRDGDGTVEGLQGQTAQAVLDAFAASALSMDEKGTRLIEAAAALKKTAEVMSKAQQAEQQMVDLQQPPAYTPPPQMPGITPSTAEINAEAGKRQAAQQEMAAYTSARAEQEAAASQWTQKMDETFLEAIPPMKAIHGEPDPTEPPPPGPPGSPTGPGFPSTPTSGGGGGGAGGGGGGGGGWVAPTEPPTVPPTEWPPTTWPPTEPPTEWPPVTVLPPTEPPTTTPPPTGWPTTEPPSTHPTSPTSPSTSVIGGAQDGVAYQPSGGVGSGAGAAGAMGGAASGSGASSAAAFGAAGGAGGLAAGAVRPGATPATPGRAAPTRAIGSTARAGSSGALSRPSGSSTGSAASRASGSSAGSGARGASTGGSAGRSGSAGGRAGTSGARGSTAGSSAGSRSGSQGGRGTSGARGTGSAGGRNGRRNEDDKAQDRDALVYDQDWLGDDDVAPGVLD